MSVKVLSWVLEKSQSRLAERLVMISIADCANADGGNAFPSIGELARKSGLTDRAVQKAIRRLVELGELVVHEGAGPRRQNLYEVVMDPERRSPPDPEPGSPRTTFTPNATTSDPEPRSPSTPNDVHHPPEPRSGSIRNNRPLTVNQTVQEPSSGELALPAEILDGEIVEPERNAGTLLDEWIRNCKRRPPNNVIGQIGKHVKALLEEGFEYGDVRTALQTWQAKGVHPSVLPSIINDVVNSGGPVPAKSRPSTTNAAMQAGLDLAASYAQRGE